MSDAPVPGPFRPAPAPAPGAVGLRRVASDPVVDGPGTADPGAGEGTSDRTAGAGTGHPAVDAALQAITNAAGLSPADQIAQYEAAHRTLQETLATIDQG